MNNEPVAWINRKGKEGEHGYLEWDKDNEAEINTPLYTHPVKELTDEEIKAVYGEYFDVENCDWLHLECIRAILKIQKEHYL
jgi:hypothetical protein